MSKSRTAKRGKSHKKSTTGGQSSPMRQAERLAHAGRLHNAGELQAAAAIYRELLSLDARNHRALFLLGLLEHQRGEHPRARGCFERLLLLAEQVADYHLWFSRVLYAMEDAHAALAEARRARELDPQLAAATQLESQLLRQLGRVPEALALLRAAVALQPFEAGLQASLGETYLALGQASLARAALERALESAPELWEAWSNLGLALQAEGNAEAAILAFEQALRLSADEPEAHFNLGALLEHQSVLERALVHMQRAVQLRPQRGKWQSALAGLLSELGEIDKALDLYRRGLALAPHPREHSSLVALQQYVPDNVPERLREARAWAALYAPEHAGAASQPAPSRLRAPSAPLRVGYVSADFRQHSVSYFFEPLLNAHDHERFAITCYTNSNARDAVSERLAQRARMVSIVGLSDAQVAEQIRADGIDILVDLSGHTLGHRLSVFSRLPAPVQLSYLGYPGTTGVPAIGWRLTDALVDPEPIADRGYSERLVRMPGAFCCFQPPSPAPAVAPLPAASRGALSFGSLNKYMKISEPVLRVWVQILTALPESRLVLQSRIFADPGSCARVLRRFSRHGVAPERVALHANMPLEAHLRLYEEIDIALDTFPWNGHTTTCLALHMGVPVLSLAGDFGAARMAVSVMHAAGLPDWVAQDEAAYVATAQRWATDLPALAELRAGLRERLASSPLCDAPRLARDVEAAYRALLGASGHQDSPRRGGWQGD